MSSDEKPATGGKVFIVVGPVITKAEIDFN